MKRAILLAAILVALCAVFAAAQNEVSLKAPDLPEAVLKAFKASHPNAEATEFSKEVVDGQTVFEIETRVEDREVDFVYLADGTLLQTEEDMAIDSLPKVVVESVKKIHPDGEIDEAGMITRGETVEFEIVVEVQETEHQLLVSSDGKVLSDDVTAEDEDEPDEDEEDESEDDEDDEDDEETDD